MSMIKRKEKIIISEYIIQKILYENQSKLCTTYDIVVPNCYTREDNECDMFAIRKTGLCDEIEIKISRSDFLCDKKKLVAYRNETQSEWRSYSLLSEADKKKIVPDWKKYKRECLVEGYLSNYYWYAVKEGIATVEEVPEWCGFITVDEYGVIKVIRKPKKLHSSKMSVEEKYKIAKKLYYRFWSNKKC